MSNWLIEIENQLLVAKQAQEQNNAGKMRASSRIIAGIALMEWQKNNPKIFFGDNYIRSLQQCAVSNVVSVEVREAATRLSARVSHDFVSPSIDPIGDAMIIVEFVKEQLKEG